MIVLLLACSTEPDWTEQRALAPALVALDKDKNGRVEAKEYDGVRYHARPFADVDTDKDGALSIGELTELFFRSDPGNSGLGPEGGARRNKAKRDAAKAGAAGTEQGVPPPGGGGPAASQGGAGPAPPGKPGQADTDGTGNKKVFPSEVEVRASLIAGTLHVLESLREELRYAGHDAPSEAELKAAADAGTLYTAEARAVLDRLEAASDAAGLAFPPSLRRTALATRPVDPPLPPVEPAP